MSIHIILALYQEWNNCILPMKAIVISILLGMSLPGLSQFVNYRQLLIFGSERCKDMVAEQTRLLDSIKDGLHERDVRVLQVTAASELNKKYKVKPGSFVVILVGKDGGEKHRTSSIIQVEELFSLIDAMPMRRNEMKKKQ